MKKMFLLLTICLMCFSYSQTLATEKSMALSANFSRSNMSHDHNLINKSGDIVWREMDGLHFQSHKCFFWSKSTGIQQIEIEKDMMELGFEPITLSAKAKCFLIAPTFFDEFGNVFLRISHLSLEHLPNASSKSNDKLGIWNIKHGFKLLEIPEIANITSLRICAEGIFVSGFCSGNERAVFIEMPNDFWVSASEQDTPWSKLDLGDLGVRLYAMGEIYKHPKSWINIDNTIIALMIEMEAASILDILQYEIKKSQIEIERAKMEGWVNETAQKKYNLSIERLENLKNYMDSLGISTERIFSLDLPSSKWVPNFN